MDAAELRTEPRDREVIMKWKLSTGVFVLFLLTTCVSTQGKGTQVTIICDDRASEISDANKEAGQLWITTADLTRATPLL